MGERTPLRGRSVAVTGAGSGIGRALALRLGRAGARVAIGDIDEGAARAAAEAAGVAAIAVGLDVCDGASFAAFLDAAEQAHGPLDVLVNNAGVDWIGSFHEEPDEVSRRELSVNLLGTIYGSRLALQRMLGRGRGHIVNVASGVGRVPLPGSATYAASKHGIVGLTESLRMEYRGSGIRFSLIQPAQVETAMLDGQGRPGLLAQVSAEEVAGAICGAIEADRFEVWVPASQGVTAKLGALLPRAPREGLMRWLGLGRIAGEADLEARREYHERAFGRSARG
jgi:NAD(P)-dependent dehydrogenase (short-subunit alcohol dehydrogenase family)